MAQQQLGSIYLLSLRNRGRSSLLTNLSKFWARSQDFPATTKLLVPYGSSVREIERVAFDVDTPKSETPLRVVAWDIQSVCNLNDNLYQTKSYLELFSVYTVLQHFIL